MPKHKIVYIEEKVDDNGVLRKFGYTIDNLVLFLNLEEVANIYRKLGLKSIKSVI